MKPNWRKVKVALFIAALSVFVGFLMSGWIVDKYTSFGTSQEQRAAR